MLVSRETDILGQETAYTYDPRGRVLSQRSVRGPSVSETTMRYSDDPDNLSIVMQVRSSGGSQDKEILGKFNQYGKPYEITMTPKGQPAQTTRYAYGPTLEIASVTDHLGRATRYSYDELDRLSELTKPDGSKVSVAYEDGGNTKIVTDENGNATRYRYDARDNLVQVRLPNVYTAYYRYDGLGKLTETVDMRNLKTLYRYDEAGNLIEKVNPNGSRESYSYDAENRLLSRTDAKEQTTHYSGYDSQGRPKEILYGDGTRVSYAYDRGYPGTLSEVIVEGSDPQRYRYSYTALGQRESVEKVLGGETYRIEYAWDDTGLLLRRRDSMSGRWQENSYDSLGRITGVRYEIDGSLTPVVSDIVYTPGSQVAGYSLPRQKIKFAYTYDANNDRMLSMSAHGPLMLSGKKPYSIKGETPWLKDGLYIQQSYRYDAGGNMTDMVQEEWDGMRYSHHYSYDVINQLTGYDNQVAGSKSQSLKYEYDPQGNRLVTQYPNETYRHEIANDSNELLSKWEGQRNSNNVCFGPPAGVFVFGDIPLV